MADRVRDACEACFEEHEHDCSGFVRAVADRLGIHLVGTADEIVESIRSPGSWTILADAAAAGLAASEGKFVIAGLKGSEQQVASQYGHVVVVVQGPLAQGKYPGAYWGSLGGQPGRDKTLNFAWTAIDRDCVTYAAQAIAT